MARKRYTTEQIIGLLREAEVRLSQGQKIGTICRSIGVSEQSYGRPRRGLHFPAPRPDPPQGQPRRALRAGAFYTGR